MHYENAIIPCFQSKTSIHLHGPFCWSKYSSLFHPHPGSLSYIITSSSSLPFYLAISFFPINSTNQLSFAYRSNFSLFCAATILTFSWLFIFLKIFFFSPSLPIAFLSSSLSLKVYQKMTKPVQIASFSPDLSQQRKIKH